MAKRAPVDLVAGNFGARGSGKSYEVKQALAASRPARLLMIDPLNEYGEHGARVASLVDMVKASTGATFALRYVPPDVGTEGERAARFSMFCALAWARGRCTVVVEEAQLFTRASSAPPAWAQITLRGRHREIAIYAVSQRPASIDKDFFSNATQLRTGRLNYADDLACMAGALRVPREAVARLIGREWIARDLLTGGLSCDPSDAVERALERAQAPIRGAAKAKKPARRR